MKNAWAEALSTEFSKKNTMSKRHSTRSTVAQTERNIAAAKDINRNSAAQKIKTPQQGGSKQQSGSTPDFSAQNADTMPSLESASQVEPTDLPSSDESGISSKQRGNLRQNGKDGTAPMESNSSADTSANDGDGQLPSDEVSQLVDEIVATPKQKRVWEVDFVRGLMILFVVWDHLMWDIYLTKNFTTPFFQEVYGFAKGYLNGHLRAATHDTFVTLFVLTSGISCSFSRSNGKRAVKMMIFAALLSAVTYAVSAVINGNLTIRFNVIHVIALSVLLWVGIEWVWKKCNKKWQKNLFGWTMLAVIIASLLVGYLARMYPWQNQNPLWFFLAEHDMSTVPAYAVFTGGDYLSFFPDFGWFLIGAFLGKLLYKQRKSLFPSVDEKWVSPFTFCGRHSLWIYFGSQVVMYGFFYLFGTVLKWL